MNSRRAFTLIELLIVIGIVGILIAITVPSLAQARFVAKRATCLTHAHGLSQSLLLYTTDWNSPIPCYWNSPLPSLGANVYAGTANVWAIPLSAYAKTDRMSQCPEALDASSIPSFGDYKTAWSQYYMDNKGNVLTPKGGFAINGWLSSNPSATGDEDSNSRDADDTTVQFPAPPPFMPGVILAWARSAANVPAFSDAIWSEAFPSSSDVAPYDLKVGSVSYLDQMGRVCIVRHRRTVNVSFMDGHAENITLPTLWTLNWSWGWTPPTKLPSIP